MGGKRKRGRASTYGKHNTGSFYGDSDDDSDSDNVVVDLEEEEVERLRQENQRREEIIRERQAGRRQLEQERRRFQVDLMRQQQTNFCTGTTYVWTT